MRASSFFAAGTDMLREWIIFALCLGFGGHVALGIILHRPESWPWSEAGLRGLIVGLGVYVAVQFLRSLWWLARGRGRRLEDTDRSEDFS